MPSSSPSSSPLRLISFPTCPFVHRARILLEHKGIPYEVENIDLSNPPADFKALSPRGRVPVLVVEGQSLFESQAICEYLEERHPLPSLMPVSLLERARDRAWFAAVGEDLFGPLYELVTAEDNAARDSAASEMLEALMPFEEALQGREWLSGDGSRFGMADLAAAPLFLRLDILERHGYAPLPGEWIPRVKAWSARMLQVPAVHVSVPDGFEKAFLRNLGPAVRAMLALARPV